MRKPITIAALPHVERTYFQMEGAVSYRLSLEEIIYLSAALMQAKTLFGLRNKPLPLDHPEKKWGEVKQGLLDKEILWDKDGRLNLCADILGRMIQALSRPKALVAIQSRVSGKRSSLIRLYVRGMFAVTVEDDAYAEDYYLLRPHARYQEVESILAETVYFGSVVYKPGKASVTLTIPLLEKLMYAVRQSSKDAACQLLHQNGLSAEDAQDLYNTLQVENHLMTYTVYAFDPDYNEGHRSAQEALLYGGTDYMWEVVIASDTATLRVTTKAKVWNQLRVISKLMDFV